MFTGYSVYYLKEFYIHHFVELKETGEKMKICSLTTILIAKLFFSFLQQ